MNEPRRAAGAESGPGPTHRHGAAPESAAPLLTVCLVVRDEEQNLGSCLASVRGLADEVVVFDTGSVDATAAVAKALGATVVEGTWEDDFSRARNSALEHCHGDWVLSLDADEVVSCDDPAQVRRMLQAAGEDIEGLQLSVDNATGAGPGSGPGYAHVVDRLFRRGVCEWRGRVHEQLVRRGSDQLAAVAYLPSIRLVHHGYLGTALEARGKAARNLALARAEVADPSFGDRGVALVRLGRALWAAGRPEEALQPLLEGAGATGNATARRQGLTAAARIALDLGRIDTAAEIVADLRRCCTRRVLPDILDARVLLAKGRPAQALSLLDSASTPTRDDDGYEHGPLTFASDRAAALVALGRSGEAADVLLELLPERGVPNDDLGILARCLDDVGRPLDDFARRLPPPMLQVAVAQVLRLAGVTDPAATGASARTSQPVPEPAEPADVAVEPDLADAPEPADAAGIPSPAGPDPTYSAEDRSLADRILDALWVCHRDATHETIVLAGASLLAPFLASTRQLAWAGRIRNHGLGMLCPLALQAQDHSVPPLLRLVAAARSRAAFGNAGMTAVMAEVIPALSADDRTVARREVAGSSPDLLASFDRIVGESAAPGPRRSAPHGLMPSRTLPAEVAVSVLLWAGSGAEPTLRCLTALSGTLPEDLPFDVTVIDPATADATATVLAGLAGDVRVLRLPVDIGPAKGMNLAARSVRGTFLAFADADAEVGPGWLASLLSRFDDEKVAAVLSPVPAALFAARNTVFQAIGGFDEGFWYGPETEDLCRRIEAGGWRVGRAPQCAVTWTAPEGAFGRWARPPAALRATPPPGPTEDAGSLPPAPPPWPAWLGLRLAAEHNYERFEARGAGS